MTDLVTANRKSTELIEKVSRGTAIGSVESAITKAWYGINHRRTPQKLPRYKDTNNLVFMTRPRLNLSDGNIRANRLLARLETGINDSVANAIRCLLDPSLQKNPARGQPIIKCNVVDENQAFIPIITNTIESLSGFPNLTAFTYTSPEGMYKESLSMVDGPSKNRTTYDIQLSFRNIVGDPVTTLFEIWGHYMALVFDATIVPYPSFISKFEIDYNSRLWSINLDPTLTYVTRIGSSIVFPLDSPNGVASNFERDRIFTSANETISISLRAHGYETNDPILVEEFNRCVESMHGSRFDARSRYNYFSQVPKFLLGYFNNIGYPYIDPTTYELSWWVRRQTFDQIVNEIKEINRFGMDDDFIRQRNQSQPRGILGTIPNLNEEEKQNKLIIDENLRNPL